MFCNKHPKSNQSAASLFRKGFSEVALQAVVFGLYDLCFALANTDLYFFFLLLLARVKDMSFFWSPYSVIVLSTFLVLTLYPD